MKLKDILIIVALFSISIAIGELTSAVKDLTSIVNIISQTGLPRR